MRVGKRRTETGADALFNVFNSLFLVLVGIVTAYPIVYVLSASISDPDALLKGQVWLYPVRPTLEGYQATFTYQPVWIGFANSLFYTSIGTSINIALTFMAAYPLSRKDFKAGPFFSFLFAFTMWFSGGMIPSYLLVQNLGLYNSRWALLLPNAMSVWNVIITRTYFQTSIPHELLESSRIDGCADFRYFFSILIPLSGPILAVDALFYAVAHWNSYFLAFIYLSDRALYPLQLFLREVLVMNQASEMLSNFDLADAQRRETLSELLKYSLIVVASIPVIIAYPFVQRHFVKGIMVGAIKG